MVGVRDAFYSKTKRFCSVSCSRSYSSNSKKASILARLQVGTLMHLSLTCAITSDSSRFKLRQPPTVQYRGLILSLCLGPVSLCFAGEASY